MRINRQNAIRLWEERYGFQHFAHDFHGNWMCKEGYGDPNYFIVYWGQRIYCGWNIHHILPIASGGTNHKENLICTNIVTNETADDKTTFWIDNSLYQVQRTPNGDGYEIYKLK